MTGITVEDFRLLYEADGAFELLDGERIPLQPLDDECKKVSDTLHDALQTFLSQQQIGSVFARTAYVLYAHPTDMIDRVRVPDLMFYQSARIQATQEMNQQNDALPLRFPPDWVAILVSQQDSYAVVDTKIDRYFKDGVRALWIVDLARQVVTIMDRNVHKKFPLGTIVPGGIRGYTPGGAIITGFEIPVHAIFE